MSFSLIYDAEAREDLKALKPHERATILSAIGIQLREQPTEETQNRKLMRPNPFFTWELRVQPFRIFFDVDVASGEVRIQRIGCKINNEVYIRGAKFEL